MYRVACVGMCAISAYNGAVCSIITKNNKVKSHDSYK